jgi:hypothetical protein
MMIDEQCEKPSPGDLVKVESPVGAPTQERHIGLFIETSELSIGSRGDPTSCLLITHTVFTADGFMSFNFPHWKFEVISRHRA